jgi:hypothetical protein
MNSCTWFMVFWTMHQLLLLFKIIVTFKNIFKVVLLLFITFVWRKFLLFFPTFLWGRYLKQFLRNLVLYFNYSFDKTLYGILLHTLNKCEFTCYRPIIIDTLLKDLATVSYLPLTRSWIIQNYETYGVKNFYEMYKCICWVLLETKC